ncbi:MAG: Crp/Fnr family transcriptional regulator [Chloroflexi bacterium]|nr:Crp/Fnr family transcriptional regulator [Chloroflexota bacterium]
MVNASVLKSFTLFKGLDSNELARVAELCDERTLKKGDRIFSEGTRATHLHLCRSGKVDVVIWVREPWNKNVVVHQAGAGELIGWSAMVAPYTYTASAECVEAGEEIRITGLDLLKLLDYNPHTGLVVWRNLSAEISARLTQTRQRLSTEWLTSGVTSPPGSSAWGEPKRR